MSDTKARKAAKKPSKAKRAPSKKKEKAQEAAPGQLEGAPTDVLAAYWRLTPRRQRFALALPTAKSQVDAMLEAGFSAKTARVEAGKHAKHPDVQIVLNHLISGALQQTQDSLDRVLRELCRVGMSDPAGMFDEAGALLPLPEWPEDLRRCVASYKIDKEGYPEVKFWNKPTALEMIGKLRGYINQPANPATVTFGVVVLPQKDSGRGRGPTETDGALIEGASIRITGRAASHATA